ncbi:MAG: SAM-dependent methyltransferase, partial [Lachnospiraceae bacterium]|nr:SAM-dependent methyltransferase [Lachnospiraceae bacterium]
RCLAPKRKAVGMNRYNLSKRLLKVASLVEPAAFLADIGCDHGFLAISLVKSGKIKKAFCSDINEGPLKRASEHIKEFCLEDKISTCLSDGLLSIKDKYDDYPFDTAVICGMGGLMGVKIIHEADEFFRRMNVFYIQLQSDIELVRIYLKRSGYQILFEDMVLEDGKYYTVMKVKNVSDESEISKMNFDEVPAILKEIYEKTNVKDCVDLKYPYYEGMDVKTYESFLLFLINKYETIKSYLPEDSDRLPVINKELEIMNEAYNRFKNLTNKNFFL